VAGIVSNRDTWPAPLTQEALHGLAGAVVKKIAPQSEADPAALLITFLLTFGNAVGASPGFRVGTEHHACNLYVCIAGDTSEGAKGMSRAGMRPVELACPDWKHTPGLSTGEGLIYHVRDPSHGMNKKGEMVVEDRGVEDKRLCVVETEFSNVLTVMERPTNNLSPVLRRAWDGGGTLSTLTRNAPLTATGAHVSVLGHVTAAELRAKLTSVDVASGFANRFLFVCARRSKELPSGGNLPDRALRPLAERTRQAVMFAETVKATKRSAPAEKMWSEVYPELSNGVGGLLGAATARSRPQVMRLAVIYALLDHKRKVEGVHLRAALAVWDYCRASAACIFGDGLGDPLADNLLELLRDAGEDGLRRTEIRDLTSRHNPQGVTAALELLEQHGRARHARSKTSGRPVTRWWAV
jgi:hypothetical protein